MTLSRCPNCDARILPGDVQCRRCRYDFIAGRRLTTDGEARRGRRLLVGMAAGAVLLLAGVLVLVLAGRGGDVEEPATDHCLAALRAIQPAVVAAHARGNPIPACGNTPPGPLSCWDPAGVTASLMPGVEGVSLSLLPTRTGFDIRCRADLDGDGNPAMYQANERIDGVRTSADGVR